MRIQSNRYRSSSYSGMCVAFVLSITTICIADVKAQSLSKFEGDAGGESRISVFDSFDGKAVVKWDVVRPDATHASLVDHPGKLTIKTQRGSIHRKEKTSTYGDGIQAKNIYLIDNPAAKEADFVVTTRVSGFTPNERFQQAGLIFYNDDDNYFKWGYEFDWKSNGGQKFCVLTENDAVSRFEYLNSPTGLNDYWLRVIKRGDVYECSYSIDGKYFDVLCERKWSSGAPAKIGLIAKNGGSSVAAELDAQFEFFSFQSPLPRHLDALR